MAIFKDNPNGCTCPQLRGERSCLECYYSQVEKGSWKGTDACFNAECLVLSDEARIVPNRKEVN